MPSDAICTLKAREAPCSAASPLPGNADYGARPGPRALTLVGDLAGGAKDPQRPAVPQKQDSPGPTGEWTPCLPGQGGAGPAPGVPGKGTTLRPSPGSEPGPPLGWEPGRGRVTCWVTCPARGPRVRSAGPPAPGARRPGAEPLTVPADPEPRAAPGSPRPARCLRGPPAACTRPLLMGFLCPLVSKAAGPTGSAGREACDSRHPCSLRPHSGESAGGGQDPGRPCSGRALCACPLEVPSRSKEEPHALILHQGP